MLSGQACLLGGVLDDLAITGHHVLDAAADLFGNAALCGRIRRHRRGVEHGERAASWCLGFHHRTGRVFAADGNVLNITFLLLGAGAYFRDGLWASLGLSLVRPALRAVRCRSNPATAWHDTLPY